VLAGHDHNYERFAEMRPDRRPADLAAGERGVRLFTVGTGGVAQRGKGSTKAGSQRFANGYGVLRLTLGDAGTYAWSFENAAGSSISDSGSGTCLPAAATPAAAAAATAPARALPAQPMETRPVERPLARPKPD
jgi:hypothetical protein